MKSYWLVLWSLWAARLVRQPTLPVRVTGGWLRGVVAPDGSHKRYLAVPYATHPEKRYQATGPEPTWRGVLEAIDENIMCLHRLGDFFIIGQEECLIANVYTPVDASSHSKYPVMVYIHGGGFYSGSGASAIYGPEYLVNKDVVLVVINYRIQIQGYACLRIKEAPGNAGMKDQVAALKWVQRNIAAFGGDPNSVTIFGESAGASSVSLHMLSPMSKGLFHRAIMQSGSSLTSWSQQFEPVHMAGLLARALGYASDDVYQIYNTFMETSDRDLVVTRVPREENNVIVSECIYAPCVEKEIPGIEPFLTESPYKLLSTGRYNKVPLIIGHNNEEGLLLIHMENDTTIPNIKLEKSLPKILDISDESERREVAMKLKKFYFGDNEINYHTLVNFSRFHGELYFILPILAETELLLNTTDKPIYSYRFDYSGRRNMVKFILSYGLSKANGATHADDIFYFFQQPFIPSFFEGDMINKMTTMWTNFAKYGEPTPETSDLLPVKWHPTNKSSPHSLVIDTEFSTSPLWYTDSLKYLRDVYSKYRRKRD